MVKVTIWCAKNHARYSVNRWATHSMHTIMVLLAEIARDDANKGLNWFDAREVSYALHYVWMLNEACSRDIASVLILFHPSAWLRLQIPTGFKSISHWIMILSSVVTLDHDWMKTGVWFLNKGCVLSRTVSITVLLISLMFLGTQSHSIIRFPYCVIYHNEMLHFISKFTLYYSAFCDFSACHKLKWLIANNFEQGYYGKLK